MGDLGACLMSLASACGAGDLVACVGGAGFSPQPRLQPRKSLFGTGDSRPTTQDLRLLTSSSASRSRHRVDYRKSSPTGGGLSRPSNIAASSVTSEDFFKILFEIGLAVLQINPVFLEESMDLHSSLKAQHAPDFGRREPFASIALERQRLERRSRRVLSLSGDLPGQLVR